MANFTEFPIPKSNIADFVAEAEAARDIAVAASEDPNVIAIGTDLDGANTIGDAAALLAVTSPGLVAKDTGGTPVSRTLVATGSGGLTVTNGDGGAGNPSVGLDTASLASLALADSAVQPSDDVSDLAETSTAKIMTADERTKLSGIEALADVTDAGNVGATVHGATAKSTPVDADALALLDSAASNVLKKVLWSQAKATLYASPTFTGTVAGVSKAMVGLGSADNTSDADKPISSATQTALNLKAPLASPALTGVPSAPTAAAGTNTTQVATTEFAATGITTMLASVAGTGAAYTATATGVGTLVDGKEILFVPHATNTSSNPTLALNGGTAYAIRGVSTAQQTTQVGQLREGVPYRLRWVAGTTRWVIVNSRTGFGLAAAVVPMTVTGGGSAFAGTTNRAEMISGQSILTVKWLVTNSVTNPTITIDGGSAITIFTESSGPLAIGQLVPGAYYHMHYATTGLRVYGVRTATVVETERIHHEGLTDALALSTHAFPLEGAANEGDPIYAQGGTGYTYWVAGVEDTERHMIVLGGTPRYLDLRMVRDGIRNSVLIYVNSGTGKLITQTKIYTASTGAMVEAWQPISGTWVFRATGGTVTEEADASDPAPVCDTTIMTGGQSHAVLLLSGSGMHGIQKGLRDVASWKPSIWPIQGASGATGLVPFSGPGDTHWWNPDTSTPGPKALAWKAALDAKPAGQPDPAVIIWGFGQNDSSKMGDDATMMTAAYRTATEELFEWMRDQIDLVVRTPIIWLPLQAYDNDASPTDAQISAIRSVMFDMAAADANLHVGPCYHDLWHPIQDQHPPRGSQMLMGYRLAGQIDNIVNTHTNFIAPVVTGITEESSGASYLLTIASDAGNPVYWPMTSGKLELDGFAVYASGADPLVDAPLTVTGYTRVSSTQLRITLGTATAGAVVMWPAGALKLHRAGRYLRTTNTVPVNNGWANCPPLMPFKSGAF